LLESAGVAKTAKKFTIVLHGERETPAIAWVMPNSRRRTAVQCGTAEAVAAAGDLR